MNRYLILFLVLLVIILVIIKEKRNNTLLEGLNCRKFPYLCEDRDLTRENKLASMKAIFSFIDPEIPESQYYASKS